MDRARECHFTIEAPAPAEHLALAWKKFVALIGLQLALYSMNRGEDWYDELEQWEKNVYWHRCRPARQGRQRHSAAHPKAFEWSVFGSIPECLAQVAIDTELATKDF